MTMMPFLGTPLGGTSLGGTSLGGNCRDLTRSVTFTLHQEPITHDDMYRNRKLAFHLTCENHRLSNSFLFFNWRWYPSEQTQYTCTRRKRGHT